MGFFREVTEGFVNGFVSAAKSGPSHSSASGREMIEACCAQLGWSIDERLDNNGMVLYFKDPIVSIRKLLITVGDAGSLAVMSVFSGAEIPAHQVSSEVLGYLLSRNTAMVCPAWQIAANDGKIRFSVAYGTLVRGLDAGLFKVLCETMCKEVHDFDSKLRQAGIL